jgi:hypothetical protein
MDGVRDIIIFGVIVGAFIWYAFRRTSGFDRRDR